MALNLAQKKEVVAELANVAAKAHSLVAAEYAGLTVAQLTELRKKARESGVYLKSSRTPWCRARSTVPTTSASRTHSPVRCCMPSRPRIPVLPVG